MNCPYCAEQIQEAAILCRFCGASRSATGTWQPPAAAAPAAPARPPGQLTIRAAGVLFILSGVLTLADVTADAALCGARLSGPAAVAYNGMFVALYGAMGGALFSRRPWGYAVIMGGTALYSLDRVLFLASHSTRDIYLRISGLVEQVQDIIDLDLIDDLLILSSVLTLVCWWGFALYIFIRRTYFGVSTTR